MKQRTRAVNHQQLCGVEVKLFMLTIDLIKCLVRVLASPMLPPGWLQRWHIVLRTTKSLKWQRQHLDYQMSEAVTQELMVDATSMTATRARQGKNERCNTLKQYERASTRVDYMRIANDTRLSKHRTPWAQACGTRAGMALVLNTMSTWARVQRPRRHLPNGACHMPLI